MLFHDSIDVFEEIDVNKTNESTSTIFVSIGIF